MDLSSPPAVRMPDGLSAGRPTLSRRRRAIIRDQKAGVAGFAVLLVIVGVSVAAPWLAPHDPTAQNLGNVLQPPVWIHGGSWSYPLGTDQLGRDTLSQLLFAGRWSLLAGFGATSVAMVIGVVTGLVAGYYPRFGSRVVTLVVNVTMGFPFVVLAITILAFVGRSFGILILVMAIGAWPVYTRVLQAEVARLKSAEFTLAATALGASGPRILFRHLFPNVMDEVLTLATLQVATLILTESFLSFLGFGIQPPQMSWGSMLSSGRALMLDQWWLAAFPGLAILITTVSVTLAGDLVAAVFDPHYRNR